MYHLYTDNYYTSVPMLEDLVNNFNTYCCGSLRKNRKHLPKKLMQRNIPELKEKGQSRFPNPGTFYFVFGVIHGTQIDSTLRTVKGNDEKFSKKEIPCPSCVKDYCAYMGGVDLSDQLFHQ